MKFEMVPCPHCGEEIKSTAKACRFCGSDEKTGWSTVSYPEGIDLPDEEEREEDYDDSLEREGFSSKENPRKGISIKNLIIGAIALALIMAFLLGKF